MTPEEERDLQVMILTQDLAEAVKRARRGGLTNDDVRKELTLLISTLGGLL